MSLAHYGRRFPDDIFKCIFFNDDVGISFKISVKIFLMLVNNVAALVQIVAWRRSGDKPLSEPMVVNLLTHIRVTRSQWVNRVPLRSSAFNYLFPTSKASLHRYILTFGLAILRSGTDYKSFCLSSLPSIRLHRVINQIVVSRTTWNTVFSGMRNPII